MADSDSFASTASISFGANRLGATVAKLTAIEVNNLKNSHDSNAPTKLITVYLAYAETATRQHYTSLRVVEDTTLYEALAQANWLVRFTDLALWCEQAIDIMIPTAKLWHVGVYSQKQPLSYLLQPMDRIEVYRSLSADPMSQRKSKVAAQK